MTLIVSDIVYRRTEPVGPGDTNAQADPDASLGGFAATTVVPSATKNAVFRDVTPAERASGIVLYRSMWVANESATDTLTDAHFWLVSEVAGGGNIAIGLDPVGVEPTDDDYQQGEIAASETTAPTGITFSAPTTKSAALQPGDVPPGYGFMVHFRLVVTAGAAALTGDGVSWRCEQGD